jgi:hypothetical protein
MTVRELSTEQFAELKETYYYQLLETGDKDEILGENSVASDIPDETVYEHYDGTEFTTDDFFCTAGQYENGKESEIVGLHTKLYEKLYKENCQFIEKLKTFSPEEIIAQSYEKVFKEDILMCFEDEDFINEKDIEKLLKKENLLNFLYREYLDSDISYMEMLRDNITSSINIL